MSRDRGQFGLGKPNREHPHPRIARILGLSATIFPPPALVFTLVLNHFKKSFEKVYQTYLRSRLIEYTHSCGDEKAPKRKQRKGETMTKQQQRKVNDISSKWTMSHSDYEICRVSVVEPKWEGAHAVIFCYASRINNQAREFDAQELTVSVGPRGGLKIRKSA